MTRLRLLARAAGACALAAFVLVLAALPAGAASKPQPIDATEQGAEAFIAFVVMVGLFAGSLFYMDRVRRRREESRRSR